MPTTYPPRRLTEGFVRGLPHASAPYFVRDTRTVGLLVTVNKLSKSYKVQRDLWVGQRGRRRLAKTVRHTLGTIDELCLDDARTQAEEVIAKIKKGIDPNAPVGGTGDGAHVWTVERMFEEYGNDLRTRDRADRTVIDVKYRLGLYLSAWKPLPITEIKRSMAREEHKRITKDHGPRVANQALKDFRAAYNLALRVVDDPDALPPNPVAAVTFNRERTGGDRVLLPDEMPDWWGKVQALPNPLRRNMHALGLLSGLRAGCLVSLRREWVHLDQKAISIPRMKSGRSFDLPLSEQMVELVQEAFKYGDVLYPKSEWVFPSRSRTKAGRVIHTCVWKEDTLPSQTGHILRHTYRTAAQRLGIDKIDARLLLDHAVPGIDGVYIHEKALFNRLLALQGRMSSHLLEMCGE